MIGKMSLYLALFGIFLFSICKLILFFKGYGFYFFQHHKELDNYTKMLKGENNQFMKNIFIIIPIGMVLCLILAFIFGAYNSLRD